MAEVIYKVQAPDGTILKIAGPEGASEEQIADFARQAHQPEPKGTQTDRLPILQNEYMRAISQLQAIENIADSTPTKANIDAYERSSRDVQALRSELIKLGGEDAIPNAPAAQAPAAAAPGPGQDDQAQKARMLVDLMGAGAGAAAGKALDIGHNVAETAKSIRDIPGLLRSGVPAGPVAPTAAPSGMGGAMPLPVAGGPAGPVGGPSMPVNQAGGPGAYNYGKAFGLTDIEAGRALDMTKNPGGANDLIAQRREGLNRIQQMGGGFAENPRYGGIMTPEPSAGGGPRASYVQQPTVPASPEVPGGKPAALAQLPQRQPIPNAPIPAAVPQGPGALSRAAGAVQRGAGAVMRSPIVSGGLGGLAAVEGAQQTQQRMAQGDTTGAAIAGAGGVGGALMAMPNSKAKMLGAFLASASPLTNYLRDKFVTQPKPRIPEPGTNMPPAEFIRP